MGRSRHIEGRSAGVGEEVQEYWGPSLMLWNDINVIESEVACRKVGAVDREWKHFVMRFLVCIALHRGRKFHLQFQCRFYSSEYHLWYIVLRNSAEKVS